MQYEVDRGGSAQARALDAALDALRSQPPEAIKVSNLLTSIGLSPALANFHFDGKDGLILAATALGLHAQREREANALVSQSESPEQRISNWLTLRCEWATRYPGCVAIGQRAAFYFPDRKHEVAKLYAEKAHILNILALTIELAFGGGATNAIAWAKILESVSESSAAEGRKVEGPGGPAHADELTLLLATLKNI